MVLEMTEDYGCGDSLCDIVKCDMVHVKYVDNPMSYSIDNDDDLKCLEVDDDDDIEDDRRVLLFVERTPDMWESVLTAHRTPPLVSFDVFHTTITLHDNPSTNGQGPRSDWVNWSDFYKVKTNAY